MSSLKAWFPKGFWELLSLPVSWREVVGALSLGLVGHLLWQQYGVLRWSNLPHRDLGFPFVGHTFRMLRESLESVSSELMRGKRALLVNFIGANVVWVDWPLYMECLHRLELDGAMVPSLTPTVSRMLGPNSILTLPGGKGHSRHKHLRNKVLASLSPKAVLGFLPDMIDLVRQTLDTMAAETRSKGFSSFASHAHMLAAEVSTLPITAGLEAELQKQINSLLDDMLNGVMSLPINLGRFTRLGRGMLAKQRLTEIISTLMEPQNLSRRSIIRDLVQATEDGAGFQTDELVDTVATLLVAGKVTTAESMPALVVQLHMHPDWAQRIAQEPLNFQGCEDSSATLQFVRETLRVRPPLGAFRRRLIDRTQAVDLGEHGTLPPGMTFAANFRKELGAMGSDFDPERWTPEVARERFLVFGGHQPHQCIGKNLALLELQVFARVLCAEYDFEVLDTSLEVQPPFIVRGYKDGLRVKIARRAAELPRVPVLEKPEVQSRYKPARVGANTAGA